MHQPQRNPSETDRHARRIAAAFAKGNGPTPTRDLVFYFENSPQEIFSALEGVARHLPPAGKDEALALGYLFLLQGLLEHLRYRSDCGYPDAATLIADFQSTVAAQIRAGQIDEHTLPYLAAALHHAKIAASPELTASAVQAVEDDGSLQSPAELRAVLTELLDGCDGDAFTLIEALTELGHAMPPEARALMPVVIMQAGPSEARSAAVLFLLDPESVVRRAAARALESAASSLSPTDVRRLIAIRNWRPENERADIDAIVRKARTAGIDCAQWALGAGGAIHASVIDGSGAQGFLLISPAGRKKRISSILIKDGIADAWSSEPESRRRVNASLQVSGIDAPMLRVSRSYLDRVLAHQLAVGLEKGKVPPFGLLQVAETLGGADWQPARLDISATLSELIDALPESMRGRAAIETVLHNSDELIDLDLAAQSWYEDGPDVAKALSGVNRRNRAKLAAYLLHTVIERHRACWAEIFVRTVLWMREAPEEQDLGWRALAIVAKALTDGRDMSEIGLIRDIAERTVAVFAAHPRM
jgi:hypothetical protein